MSFLETNKLYCGYSEELLPKIRPNSISLSFWSPPYFLGKEYEKELSYHDWQKMLKQVICAHFPIIKPGGFVVINIADIFSFKDENMPRIMGQNPQNRKCPVTKEMIERIMEKHPTYKRKKIAEILGCSEQTVDRRLHGNNIRGGKYEVATKVKITGGNLEKYAESAGFYLYDIRIWAKDPAWANSKWTTNTLKAVSEFEYLYIFWKPGEYVVNKSRLSSNEWREWGLRQIWHIPSVRKNDIHQAMFPIPLASRVIRLYSDPGETVLDPFVGSGTTAISAIRNNRNFIGIDKEKAFIAVANSRINDELRNPNLIGFQSPSIYPL